MESWQRFLVRPMVRAKLSELHGQEFESFFHDLMQLRYPDFVPVRTQGRLGDRSADGLTINDRKLYACYAPETYNASEISRKFTKDLTGALEKRRDEFDTFVFVHNDLRGVGPVISSEISKARKDHPYLKFEVFGACRFIQEVCKLDVSDVEDLLGQSLPAKEVVVGVEMEDLAPLLAELGKRRIQARPSDVILPPPRNKLEYNGFSPDLRDELISRMKYVPLVEAYYQQRNDPFERDNTAAAFHAEYQRISQEYSDPDEILYQMQQYVLGNKAPTREGYVNAQVILMYFFGECEIFEIPPEDWQPSNEYAEVAG
ncbi:MULTISPECIES: ABC-three component system protein [Thermobifida]|nr:MULTISPECIES: ABC-three component system protein [Thermobifida]MDD6792614.1 hypothetical protein [Thermobifida fusca]